MEMKWTPEQQQVINLRDRDLLISAAAGSGKTAVLVERIIQRVLDPVSPLSVDELLVVTFTKAAAAEMKERIRIAIEKKAEENPENEHLANQSILIHNAQITTIDSFCMSVIKDHFHEIDLNPNLRTGEEGELRLLMKDAMKEIFEKAYEEGEDSFLDFITSYGSIRGDESLEDMILNVYQYSKSNPNPDEWLASCLQTYDIDSEEEMEQSNFIKEIIQYTQMQVDGYVEFMRQAADNCMLECGPKSNQGYFQELEQQLLSIREQETYQKLYEGIRGFSFGTLRQNKKDEADEELVEENKYLRDTVKKGLAKLVKDFYFQEPLEMLSDMKQCKPYIHVIVSLVKQFDEYYTEEKRKKNILDFSDMEHYALRILRDPQVAVEYQKQFKEIMVDEYQDSNYLQEEIFQCISRISQGEYNMFMVGDVKQSIYRFRLARPDLFLSKYQRYSIEESQTQRISLSKNFRSRSEVLKGVNYLFERIMKPRVGGILYDEEARLNLGASYRESADMKMELRILEQGDYEEEKKEVEARYIASRIEEMVGVMEIEKGLVEYRDIVILLRGIKNTGEIYQQVLSEEGIPVHIASQEGYFNTREIKTLIDYLKIMDNPKQDIPLTTVLVSSFGGLNEEELAIIRGEMDSSLPFHDAVFTYRKEGRNEKVSKKLIRFESQLEDFKEKSVYLPIHELLTYIVKESGYLELNMALCDGEQRMANIEMLIEKGRTFDSTSYKGVFHFVRYIEQLRKYELDFGEANLQDENANVVRIMTIHKSKGLEFPVVFLANTAQKFNARQYSAGIQTHPSIGLGIDLRNQARNMMSPGIVKKSIIQSEKLESLGEEIRVLYVALTRAKEKLVITGILEEAEEEIQKGRISLLSESKTYLDMMIPYFFQQGAKDIVDAKLVAKDEFIFQKKKEALIDDLIKIDIDNISPEKTYDEKTKEVLEEQFNYFYPHKVSSQTKPKYTVSELKQRYIDENEENEFLLYKRDSEKEQLVPEFIRKEKRYTGGERGSLYHKVFELIDYSKQYTIEEISDFLDDMVDKNQLSKEMRIIINEIEIKKFLDSPYGKEMHEAAKKGDLFKEQPFVLGVELEEAEETVLVQGIIDVYYERDGKLTLLDYKTDNVEKKEVLIHKYKEQLRYYKQALEQLTGKEVEKQVIYSTKFGEGYAI